VPYVAQPSATQRCGDAPALTTAGRTVVRRLSTVRKAKWQVSIPLASTGVGHVDVTLQKGKKKIVKLATAALDVKPGPVALKLALPKGQRKAARMTLVLVSTAPDGSKKVATKALVDLRRDAKTKAKHKKKTTTKKKKGAGR
jgi:hypothetical protein